MGGPLVTVVTVCFNAERHIAEAIESVLAQTYPELEYLIVDGGSTDATLDIIRAYQGRFAGRLSWTSESDTGIYDAMNKGIARSSGSLIGMLNADDAYLPETVERTVEAYLANPGSGAVYGDVDVVDDHGDLIRTERARVPWPGETRPDRMPMCHQSLFVAHRTYEEIGAYEASYRILADYEWILRALSHGVIMTHVPIVFSRFRAGGVCSAQARQSVAEREMIRVAYGANPLRERVRRLTSDLIRVCSPVTRRLRAARNAVLSRIARRGVRSSADGAGSPLEQADEPGGL